MIVIADGRLQAALLALGAACAGCGRLALDNPGGGRGGGGAGPPPPPAEHPVVGLSSAVGGAGRARIEWRTHAAPEAIPEFAVFVAADPAAVFAGPPAAVDPAGQSLILEGLADGTEWFVGLGVREHPVAQFEPSGPILRFRTGAPVYVDPAAPAGGDGTTPATATNDLTLAILDTFFLHGGGNVWVKEGTVPPSSIPVYGGVCLSGGFAEGMTLELRDPVAHPTRIEGLGNQPILDITNGNGPGVLDGLVLDGLVSASEGIRNLGLPAEIRSTTIDGCRRAIRMQSLATGPSVPVVLASVTGRGATVEGLSVIGPHDLVLEGCTFELNAQEGASLGSLIAPAGGTATLRVRASSFQRNGAEGLDCHMAAPPDGGAVGGVFAIRIEDCDFEQNVSHGLVVDVDYEAFPAWSADIEIRGCRARANRTAGIHLDLDASAAAFVHRVLASANGGDGILVTSETFPGTALLSSSALVGNLGAGVRASQGNFGVLASHCVFSGNAVGGLVSEAVTSAAASGIAYGQGDPWTSVRTEGCLVQAVPDPEPFARAAREFVEVLGSSGGTLELASAPATAPSGAVEIADDGQERAIVSLSGARLTVDPAPVAVQLPGSVGFFGRGSGVEEDLHLTPASLAIGAGMTPPGAPATDAGLYSSPSGGRPGAESGVPKVLFRLARTVPAWTRPIEPGDPIAIEFDGGSPDAGSIPLGVFAVDEVGTSLAITAFLDGTRLTVAPPPGGWAAGQAIELFPTLRSTEGRRLAAPVVIPLSVP